MSLFNLFGNAPNQFSRNRAFGKLAWLDLIPFIGNGCPAPTIASAATISPVTPVAFISGTTAINTIVVPPSFQGGGQITLIPTGLWTTGTSGNIALGSTAVVNKALILTWDAVTAKWYPSY